MKKILCGILSLLTIAGFAGNLIKHPCFDELRELIKGYRVVGNLKNTNSVMNNSFWIGVYPGMTDLMINYLVEKMREFVAKRVSLF